MQASVRVPAFGWVALVWLFCGCRPSLPSSTHSAQSAVSVRPAPARLAPGAAPKWQLLPQEAAANRYVLRPDGSRLFLVRGMRFVERPDGSWVRGEQVFDSASVRFTRRPERLGGGYWFFRQEGAETEIWRAAQFASELKPVARLGFAAERLIAGFNGLWAQSASRDRLQWVSDDDSQSQPLGQLPRTPALAGLAVGRAGRAVALASVLGPVWTDDFGAHWGALTVPGTALGVQVSARGEPQVRTADALWDVRGGGGLVETSATGSDTLFESLRPSWSTAVSPVARHSLPAVGPDGTPRRPGPRGRGTLRAALLSGVADSTSSALVIEGDHLIRVDLREGRLLERAPYSGVRTCRGLPFGGGAAFVCGVSGGPGEVYQVEGMLLRRLGQWDAAPLVRGGSGGTLLIEGECPAGFARSNVQRRVMPGSASARRANAAVCVLHPERQPLLLEGLEAGNQQRVVALRHGGAAVLRPPSGGDEGRLTVFAGTFLGAARTLQLAELDEAVPSLQDAHWPVEWQQGEDEQLRGWLSWGEAFAAVSISLDGVVRVGAVQESTSESMFFGGHVLQVLSASTLRQTEDFGATWTSAVLPPALLTTVSPASLPVVRGCSSLGCVYGDWGRVGYGPLVEATRAPSPEKKQRALGYSFWSLSCQRGRGELGAEPRPGRAGQRLLNPPRGGLDEPIRPSFSRSSWLSLMDRPGPSRAVQDASYDLGQVDRRGGFRGYAWGPGTDRWGRYARWVLYAQDRFAVRGPWSTAPSPVPWTSAVTVAAAFGLDYGVTANWSLQLSASGTEGLLRVQQSRKVTLFLVEAGRAPVQLVAGTLQHRGQFAGAVKVSGRWFVAESHGDVLAVYQLVGTALETLGHYPLATRLATQLVGNATRDGLAIVQKTRREGWYLFPLDWVTGRAAAGLHIPRDRLSQFPRVCSDEDKGWEVVSSVPLTDPQVSESNTHLQYRGDGSPLPVHALEAKLLLSASGPCVDSLAALARQPISLPAQASQGSLLRETVPLVVTEPMSEQRWHLRCGR